MPPSAPQIASQLTPHPHPLPFACGFSAILKLLPINSVAKSTVAPFSSAKEDESITMGVEAGLSGVGEKVLGRSKRGRGEDVSTCGRKPDLRSKGGGRVYGGGEGGESKGASSLIIPLDLIRQIHLVLVPMTPAALYCDSESQSLVLFAEGDLGQLLCTAQTTDRKRKRKGDGRVSSSVSVRTGARAAWQTKKTKGNADEPSMPKA